MGRYILKLPDVGEGVAEAELVEWSVKVGDYVAEDDVLAAVMTDKATVEIPSAVAGRITWLGGEVGDVLPVGAELVHIEVAGEEAAASPAEEAAPPPSQKPAEERRAAPPPARPEEKPAPPEDKVAQPETPRSTTSSRRVLAAPSVRRLAMEAGIDLGEIRGTGPAGRVLRADVEKLLARGAEQKAGARPVRNLTSQTVKVTGLRRRISEKMSLSWSHIPHITIVEEVDVTKLEELRASMNGNRHRGQVKLTILPFIIRSIVLAVREQPEMNATFDDAAGVITRSGGVHIGIATQTESGLMAPVVRHAEALSIWAAAAEVKRLADAARDGSATRDELTGSTITISSLGALGALATTPIINHPEVAMVGINRMAVRPHWNGSMFEPRKMMNIFCSFDHRVIDGWNAAVFVQHLKQQLEEPALLFAGREE